jgi:hypothetical protein
MAPESAEFDPFPLDGKLEQAPDSRGLRVSTNTLLESGIPPARFRQELSLVAGDDRLDLALAGVSRTEANLGQLLRGLKHLAAGASAAREANLELANELDELRAHLVHVNEEETALRYRMAQLEQMLDIIRHEFSRERDFLIEQQDLFLIEIMSDHDRQIADLRRNMREGAARKADQAELAEVIAQRDQAREYATRCERERDLAWQELALGHAPTLAPAPSPMTAASDSSAARTSAPLAIGSVALKAVQVTSQIAVTEREPTRYSLSGDDVSE